MAIYKTVIAFMLAHSAAGLGPSCALNRTMQPASMQQASPSDTVITLERTVCYGTCPSYVLTITGDGTVLFNGRQFVRIKGLVKSKITRDQLQQLISEFNNIDYFSLDSEYSYGNKACAENWTDNPTAITSIKINGKSKSVKHYYGCRGAKILEELAKLESKIDDIVDTRQWIK